MRAFVVMFALMAMVSIGGYSYSSTVVDIDDHSSHMSVSAQEQDPQPQPAQPEGDRHCERPDPDNPEVGATDPNKIGCSCARKCENGRPTENYEDGKRCKVHCKPENCDCPNPCKT